jgi:hypothetical protein
MKNTATENKKKVPYHYQSFPFDKLSIVTEGKGFFRNMEYKRVRMNTRVDGHDYTINFDRNLKTGPIIYLVYKDAPLRPGFPVRFTLHPAWETKDADGNVSKKESAYGNEIKAFWVKFRARITELLAALPKENLISIIGLKRANDIEGSLDSIVSHPDMEGLDGVPDENKSEQFKAKLFVTEYSKLDKPPPKDELLMIPGTDLVIFTNILKTFGDNSADDGQRIMDYAKLKPRVYCKDSHENATHRYFSLTATPIFQSPSVTYGKDGNGDIKLILSRFNITNQKMYGSDGSLTTSELEEVKKRRLAEMEELGFSPNDYESATKKPKMDNSMSELPVNTENNNSVEHGSDYEPSDCFEYDC